MPVPVDLSKLSDVVKNDVVKKTVYDKLVAKVNNNDTSGFVLKTEYDRDKLEMENKIPDTSGLVKKTDFNARITEIEGKMPSISGLATNVALTAVENKIPNINSLVKKTDYDIKITEIEKKLTDYNHDKYTTTPEFNTLAADVFNARLAQANSITKTDFDAKLSSLNRKITSNKSKHLLVENELKKLETFDSIYFRGKSHFEEDGTQKYLVFQPMQRSFKRITGVGNGNHIYYWKSKGLSDERINSIKTSDYGITSYLSYYDTNKVRVKFNGGCLKQDQGIFLHGGIVNICIVYEITDNFNVSNYPILENCLFGAVKLTENADIDKYGYSGYGIGFDRHGSFSFGNGVGRNVITVGVDISASTKTDNRKKDILILGKRQTQGLEHTLSP